MTCSLEQIPRDHQIPILPRREPSVGKLESKWCLKRPNREAKFMGSSVLLLFNLHLNNESEESVSLSVMSYSLWPHGLEPARLLCPWNSLGKNTGVGCHSLLQGIFPTQGSNLHFKPIPYCLSHRGSPINWKGTYKHFVHIPYVLLYFQIEHIWPLKIFSLLIIWEKNSWTKIVGYAIIFMFK